MSEVWIYVHAFESETEALEYAIRNQRDRRNLTGADIVRCVAALDKRKPLGGQGANQHTGATVSQDIVAGPTANHTAELLGVSPATVNRVRTVLDHGTPEIKAAVESGDKSIHRAYVETQEARTIPPEIRAEVAVTDPPPISAVLR